MNDISQRYGRALYEVAKEQSQQHQIYEKLIEINKTFQDGEVRSFFMSLNVDKETKLQILDKIFNDDYQYLKNFCVLLIQRHRLDLLDSITQAFQQNLYQDDNIKIANIETAFELTSDQQVALINALEHKYQSKIDARMRVNPDLINGIVVKIEDDVLDGSLKNQLNQLSKQLRKGVKQHAS